MKYLPKFHWDIPAGLAAKSITLTQLIEDLTIAVSAYDALEPIAQYFAEEDSLFFRVLLEKALAYQEAEDSLIALSALASDPEDISGIFGVFVDAPEETLSLFYGARTKIAHYASYGPPHLDLEGIGVFDHFELAYGKYETYLEFLEAHEAVLSLTEPAVMITDIPFLEHALTAYYQIGDPDVEKALLPQHDLLVALLAGANRLLSELTRLAGELQDLMDELEDFRDPGSVNSQNYADISAAVDLFERLSERFVELGGSLENIYGYYAFQDVLDELARYRNRSDAPFVDDHDDYPYTSPGLGGVVQPPGAQSIPPQVNPPLVQQPSGAPEIIPASENLAQREPLSPGGGNRETPPGPSAPSHVITSEDGEIYIEWDESGIPLGEWVWDEINTIWIFEEYGPLSGLPQTGDGDPDGFNPLPFGFVMIVSGMAWIALRYAKKRAKR